MRTNSPGGSHQIATNEARTLTDAIDVFKADKKNQGITDDVLNKYARELDRLRVFAEARNAFTVAGLTRELLIDYQAEWDDAVPIVQHAADGPGAAKEFSPLLL